VFGLLAGIGFVLLSIALAVLLDALVVRLMLVPVLLRIGHHRSWHLPGWLARILPKTRFTH